MILQTITPVQIRFADVDWMGHVNNAVYLSYLELARLDYFKQANTIIDWRKTGFILAHIDINYIMPVLLTDNLFVKTRCTKTGNKSFDLSHSLFKKEDGHETEMANAMTVLVCYDYESKKSVVIPHEWKKFLL